MSVRQRLLRLHITENDTPEIRSIAVVLPLTLATIIVTPLIGDSRWGALVSVALIGGGALISLGRSGVRAGIRHPALAIVVLAMLTVATAGSAEDPTTPSATAHASPLQVTTLVLFALLLLLTPALVVLRLLMRPRITLDTVAGALTAYLQVGIFFAALFRLSDLLDGGDFFSQGPHPVSAFQYFSFVTLTTVGYGDLTPASSTGQLLASLEALTGQLFLVSVVALVVGNLGRDLPHRAAAAAAVAGDAAPGAAGDPGSEDGDDPGANPG